MIEHRNVPILKVHRRERADGRVIIVTPESLEDALKSKLPIPLTNNKGEKIGEVVSLKLEGDTLFGDIYTRLPALDTVSASFRPGENVIEEVRHLWNFKLCGNCPSDPDENSQVVEFVRQPKMSARMIARKGSLSSAPGGPAISVVGIWPDVTVEVEEPKVDEPIIIPAKDQPP